MATVFYVYNFKTKKIHGEYPTERGARISATALVKRIMKRAVRSCEDNTRYALAYKGSSKDKRVARMRLESENARVMDIAREDAQAIHVDTKEYFDTKVDRLVVRHNLLSGKPFTILENQAGGCCDPSTETYHSM